MQSMDEPDDRRNSDPCQSMSTNISDRRRRPRTAEAGIIRLETENNRIALRKPDERAR
jgi:hypothetical protein